MLIGDEVSKQTDKPLKKPDTSAWEPLANSLATSVTKALGDAVTEFAETGGKLAFGRLFNSLMKSIADSMIQTLVADTTKAMTEGLKKAFTDAFGAAEGLAQTLATAAVAAIAVVLQALSHQSEQDIAVAKEGLASVIEETEKVRGIISGESTVKLKEVADNLRDALMPTNDILRAIEANTRLGGVAAQASPLAQQVGGV